VRSKKTDEFSILRMRVGSLSSCYFLSNVMILSYYYIPLGEKKFQLIFLLKKNIVAIPGMIYFDTGSSSFFIPVQDETHSITSQIAQSIFVTCMGVSTK